VLNVYYIVLVVDEAKFEVEKEREARMLGVSVIKLILVHHSLVYSFALIESDSKPIAFQDSNSTAGL
jgi:hypothetical protein